MEWIEGIERAFFGVGGDIFYDYYMSSLFDETDKTLQQVAVELQEFMIEEVENGGFERQEELVEELAVIQVDAEGADEYACELFVRFFAELVSYKDEPGRCGEIVGIMVREGYAKQARDILEWDKLCDKDTLSWDS